ncbi:30S ribosomal protein S27ae [Candidatus Woesearchaeota archaeon]|nr:30S ribosomal protein S27ae [Candidatus Woesearchaeota archaeon]
MAAKKKGGKPAPKQTKEKAKKETQKIHKVYEVAGEDAKRKNKFCPKCGPGTFMANHKDRSSCGKCGYMEKK